MTTSTDEWAGGGQCSLREAVRAMNLAADFQGCTAGGAGFDTIQIAGQFPQLTITGTDDTTDLGDLDIRRSGTTISSLAGSSICWDAANVNRDRVLDVNPQGDPNFTFTLRRIALCNGLTAGDGGAVRMGGSGGQLTIEGVLSTSTVAGIISSNKAANGGAIYARGNNLLLDNVLIFDNEATGVGGGAVAMGAGTIRDSDLRGNRATGVGGLGGAVHTTGAAEIRQSSFQDNSATGSGGAVAASGAGVASVEYSRLVNNTAGLTSARQELAAVSGGAFDIEHDWWGSNAGQPSNANAPAGVFDTDPLELRLTGPASLNKSAAGTLTADLRGGGAAQTDLDGLPPLPFGDPPPDIFFDAVKGTLSGDGSQYLDGKEDATFTAGTSCGAAGAKARLDSQTVSHSITIPCDHDLTVAKANNVSGSSVVGGGWNWTLTIANAGTDPAVFTNLQKVLKDDLPSSGLSYGTVTDSSANMSCSIATSTLTCSASGTLSIAGGASITVTVPVTANDAGSYTNPRAAGVCSVDPDALVQTEASESNNGCGPDTVAVSAATTTTSITSDLPDPSTPGEDVTVQYTVSGRRHGDG